MQLAYLVGAVAMIEYFSSNPASFWFLLGFLLLAIEVVAFGFSSGVLLFGSFGALITGALFWLGVLPQTWLLGIAVFTISSALCAALLWKPLKKMQSGAEMGQDRSSDLIGHEFRLTDDVSLTNPGSTRYSGIEWRVELDDQSKEQVLTTGTKVRVSQVQVGVFIVAPI